MKINKIILLLVNIVLGINCSKEAINWKSVEEKAHDAVVQIEAKSNKFNWLEPYKTPEQSGNNGSGFFIDAEGHIFTNYHVVEDANSLGLYIPSMGRQKLKALVVGVCPEVDCALLKLTSESLNIVKNKLGKVSYLELGNSDELYQTQPVMALGYPFGKRNLKTTLGEVAGKDFYENSSFTHITAPLNPGNSGGPVVNSNGQVVGVSTAILTESQNVCYFTDINDFAMLIDNLLTEKVVRKPKLGFNYNSLTEEHGKLLGISEGVYVNTVATGSLAHNAGFQVGDVLTSINGFKVDSFGDVCINKMPSKIVLQEYFKKIELNKSINFTVFRSGKTVNLSTIFKYDLPVVHKVYAEFEPELLDYEIFGGMCVMQLAQNHIDLLGSASSSQSLVITNILSDSVIESTSCIKAGQILNSIDGIQVNTLTDLRKALSNLNTQKPLVIKVDDTNVSGITTAVSFEKILKDETRLSKEFKFQVSPIISQYLR